MLLLFTLILDSVGTKYFISLCILSSIFAPVTGTVGRFWQQFFLLFCPTLNFNLSSWVILALICQQEVLHYLILFLHFSSSFHHFSSFRHLKVEEFLKQKMSSNNDNDNPVQKIRHLNHIYPQNKYQFLFTGVFITNWYIHTLLTLELDNRI